MRKLKYKLVNKKGNCISKHYTKKAAEKAQLFWGVRGKNFYVRKL